MQTLLFSRTVERFPKISFPCHVNGKALTATLTHTENTGVQVLYLVSFSDGHRDAYLPGDAEVKEGFGRTRTLDAYEEAIFDDLSIVQHLEKGAGALHVRVQEERGEGFNVWIREKRGYYSIYYKGQYQFTLRYKGRWESGTVRERGYVINGRLAKLLADYLDERFLKNKARLKRA